MRASFAIVLLLASAVTARAQSSFVISGFLTGREVESKSQASWLDHGYGRLDAGGAGSDDRQRTTLGTLQVGLDWTPSRYFDVHAQGLGRYEPSGYGGRRVGVPEAWAQLHAFAGANELQLRAGAFFLPTSRENRENLWSSPYTLTLSALNSWIAQEVRPIGVDLQWKHSEYITAGATAFRGNGGMGALIAWRGWSMGNRLSVYNEVLPLPPLFSLRDPALLGKQNRKGTTSFGGFEGRTGIAARLKVQVPERALIQLTHIDNRGDRALHSDEYQWQTKFNILGAEVHGGSLTAAAEIARGDTGMGFAPGAFVQMRFQTAYCLLSTKPARIRYTIRYDTFRNQERDHSVGENDAEDGHAVTVAVLSDLSDRVRLGLEYVRVTGDRAAAEESGADPDTQGTSAIVELRLRF